MGRLLAVFVTVVAASTFLAAVTAGDQSKADQQLTGLVTPLKPYSFLLGEWTAVPGAEGETGAFSFKSEVQGHIIVRANHADYPAARGRPASRHDDLMVMSAENGVVRATYYDNEEHVIHYVVASPHDGQALFESEAKPSEPRYRLRYELRPDRMLEGQFEVAPPGKPNEFSRYLTWTARRAR